MVAATIFESPANVCAENAAEKSKDYVRSHWKFREPKTDSNSIFDRAQSHTLCISGMAFQDAWNIDLQRLKRCCVHVVTAGNRMVPFCSHYLTSSSGNRLADIY